MKRFKKLFSALIAVMMVLGLFGALPAAAADVQTVAVTVTPDKTAVASGGDVTLSFAFSQKVEDVSSFSFYVQYDPDLFTYDIEKSKMPDEYYANCNQNPYTVSYLEDATTNTNEVQFGFTHSSTVATAFDGTDDYNAGVFYNMVFTAKQDITYDISAVFNCNVYGTDMLTYYYEEGATKPTVNNPVNMTINGVNAGDGGDANAIKVTVKGPAWEDKADWSWYNTTDTEFVITTPEQLAGLASIVNGTAKDSEGNVIKDDFSGKTVKLGNDIDLQNLNWTPIGRLNRYEDSYIYDTFAGTFDGQNHTITNLSITYDVTKQTDANGNDTGRVGTIGLFGIVQGTEESKVEIKKINVKGNVNIMAGDGPTQKLQQVQGFGGLIGRAFYANISECIVEINITEDISKFDSPVARGFGGIAGYGEVVKIEKCANLGNINATKGERVAGFVGWIKQSPCIITDSYNRGNISSPSKVCVGGFVGYFVSTKNTESSFERCYNTGIISGSENVGAFIGQIDLKKPSTIHSYNLYYLQTSCDTAVGVGSGFLATYNTAEEMTAGCFEERLNVSDNNAWKQGSTYPILTCQADEEPGPAHALQHVEAKEATCAEEGNQEYWKCSVCGKLFSDAEGKTEITAVPVIAKLAHTLVKTEAKDATCLAEGNQAYWTCSACGKLFFDENGTTETTAEAVVIAKLAHTLVKTEAKEATCTEAGNNDFWTCSECERLFSDNTGATEINQEDTVIPAPGHAWGDWKTITPATDASEGEEERECSRCHMKETQSIPPLTHIHGLEHINAVPANCTEPGNIEYWQCNTSAEDGMTPCHRYFKDEAGTTEIDAEDTVVKALGHDFGNWELTTPATCSAPGVETRVCSRDASHTETRNTDIDPNAHDYQEVEGSAKAATCTTAGKEADQECSHCHDVIAGKEIPANGHSWSDWKLTTPATCTEAGQEIRTCSACDEEETREVDALGHDLHWVIDAAPEGETAGTRHQECSRCDYRTEPEEYFVITLIVDDEETTVDVPAGSDFILPEGPEKEGFKFLYWEGSKYYPGDKYKADAPHTFKAVYEKIEEPTEGGSENTAPKTGDTNNASTWIIIMAVAFALLVGGGIFAIRKKVK